MHLNKWIIRPRHTVKLLDDVLHNLNGAKWFSVMDSTSSFLTTNYDDDSSKPTMFGTPFVHYRYLRMPMVASLSSGIYRYKVDGHLDGIKNYMVITDDIIMYGFKEDGSNHDSTVRKLLDKARCVGMQFNPTKCQFKQKQVKFFGLILTCSGVIPDPAKIEVLRNLPELIDEKLLQFYFWEWLTIYLDLMPTWPI